MSLIGADKTSNAAKETTDYEPEKGEPGKLGYTFMPYPNERPAQTNAEIKTTKDNFAFADPQDGTSAPAYLHQEETYNVNEGAPDDGVFESEEGEGEHFDKEEAAEKKSLSKGLGHGKGR